MSTAVLQLILLKLKPGAHLDEVGSPTGDALLDVVSAVKKGGSKNRAFFGRQLENPDIGVLAFGGFDSLPLPFHYNLFETKGLKYMLTIFSTSLPVSRRSPALPGVGAQALGL